MAIRPTLLVLALLAGCAPRPEAPEPDPVARLAAGCFDIGIKRCRTTQGGYFSVGGHALYWQLQEGETPQDLAGAGYVLLAAGADGLRPVASGLDGHVYEAPVLVWKGRIPHVALAGGMRGTGHFNADALYRWTPGAERPLAKLDAEGWRNDLGEHLPAGLAIRKGVAFQYGAETITARSSVWRREDGDCCPSAGEAFLTFDIRGDRLALASVQLSPPDRAP